MLTELIPIVREDKYPYFVMSGKVVSRFQPANQVEYRCVRGRAWHRVSAQSWEYDARHNIVEIPEYRHWVVGGLSILQEAVMMFRGLLGR